MMLFSDSVDVISVLPITATSSPLPESAAIITWLLLLLLLCLCQLSWQNCTAHARYRLIDWPVDHMTRQK